MITGRRWPLAGLLAGVVALGLAVAAPAAQAAPAPTDLSSTTTTTAPASAGAGLTSGTWTTERMANAHSADNLIPRSTAQPAASHPTGAFGLVAPSAGAKPAAQERRAEQSRRGDVSPLTVNASATVGKVFFHNPVDGLDYVCSASTLNSGSKELVLTAGHCVHGGQGGQWMTNWVFVPLYNYGSQPYGQWQAKYFTTFNSWISNSDLDRDVGMVTMWPNGYGAVVNTVGGNGLAYNGPYNLAITILGYPASYPYDGGWQWACQGTTSRFGSEFKIAMQCGFTGGSSGSPWLYAYDNNTGLGYSNGAMSTLDSANWNRASYFDTAVYNMYASVANLT